MTEVSSTAPDSNDAFFAPRQRLFLGLAGFFVTSWLLGDLTGGKYFSFFGHPLSVGMIPFPLTFVLTDIVHEFYGPRGARQVTLLAAGMAAYAFVLLQLMVHLPTATDSVVPDSVFRGAFGQSIRLFGASMTAFLVGQLIDVKVFHAIRERTGKKHVWLRANGSTAISQLIDTVIINTAFLAGQRPLSFIGTIIVNSYLAKIVAAVALTPLLYFVHGVVERRLERGDVASPSANRRMIGRFVLGTVLSTALYLAVFPTGMEPVAYDPPAPQGFDGMYRTTEIGPERVELTEWVGPEAFAYDADGRFFAGLADGRIVMRGRRGRQRDVVNTGGRPLGMVPIGDRRLAVADAELGLLEVNTEQGHFRVLVNGFEGHRFRFTDDVTVLPDGRLVFTDASQRFGIADYRLDLLEHSGTGRVFLYDPARHDLQQLARGLQFANGVAASVAGDYVVVCETGARALRRIDLVGPQRGRIRNLRDGLPGYCDNVRRDPNRDVFWVALPAPSNPMLDATARRPFLRSVVARLPVALQPRPEQATSFLAVDGGGRVLMTVNRPGTYGPVTTVVPHDGRLVLGSLSAPGIATLSIPPTAP